MGRSITVHVIGATANGDEIFACMNRMEIAQTIFKVKKEGKRISFWHAQTKTGCRILGTDYVYEVITTNEIQKKLPKLVQCDVCNGNGCPVCNFSGVTKLEYYKRWMDWQLEDMKKKYR